MEIDHLNSSAVDKEGSIAIGMDMGKFYRSFEWDVLAVPAHYSVRHYAGDSEPFPLWTFELSMRRKYNFYVVNIIIPLVAHTAMTILVFYLPSESKQKIPLSITILLSLTVYFLLLTEIMPSTSLMLPMLGEYLLFTLIMVTISLFATVLSLNVHFRSAATNTMPNWVRKVFLYFLPRVLHMQRPKVENSHDVHLKQIKLNLCSCLDSAGDRLARQPDDMYQFGSKRTKTQSELLKLSKALNEETLYCGGGRGGGEEEDVSPDMTQTIDNAVFIANHLKKQDEFKRVGHSVAS